jgi:hypothetical protein
MIILWDVAPCNFLTDVSEAGFSFLIMAVGHDITSHLLLVGEKVKLEIAACVTINYKY